MTPAHGDILRTFWPRDLGRSLPLYLGTGRLGGCFNRWGLHDPEPAVINPRVGRSALCHRDLFAHGAWGQDHQIPFARLLWTREPAAPERYTQRQSLADGALHTTAKGSGYAWECTLHTAPADPWRDALEWHITWSGKLPDLEFAPTLEFTTNYQDRLEGRVEAASLAPSAWHARWRLGSADAALHFVLFPDSGRAELSGPAERPKIRFKSTAGRLRLRLVAGSWIRRAELAALAARRDDLASHGAAAWRARWRATPALPIPSPGPRALAARSLAYLLSTFEPGPACPPPPAGFSANQWGFHFPQDISFIHPALLRLGHTDLARGIVEFYASRRAQMEEFTRRIWNVPGTFWAWEFPLGTHHDLLRDGAPNPFQFELHNAAYPARMAWETAQALGDPAWLREVAWPVILGGATFYAALLRRERDGTWGLRVTPSMGQDEYGGENAPNYVDALQAAAYCLRIALKAASAARLRPADVPRWRAILQDGLALPRLIDRAHGVYASCETTPFQPDHQKHPVQLGPVIFLPGAAPLDAPTRAALAKRDILARGHRDGIGHGGVRGSYYDGWTLSALWLADACADEPDVLEARLREAPVAQYIDADWIQIYESSGFWHPYYLTSHGLFLQAMARAWPATRRAQAR